MKGRLTGVKVRGYTLGMKKMAVLMVVLLAVGFVLALAGCAGSADVTAVEGVAYTDNSDEKALRPGVLTSDLPEDEDEYLLFR